VGIGGRSTLWPGSALVLAAWLLPAGQVGAQEAQAEASVAVPGLRAVDGDDAIANELTGWLRAGTTAVQGWELHPAMVSLEQLMIVHDCEGAEPGCLSKISGALEADGLISGSLSRKPADNEEGYELVAELFFFDASTGTVEKTSTLRFTKSQANPHALAMIGQTQVQILSDAPLDELGKEQALDLMLSADNELGLDKSTLDLLYEDRREEFPIWPAAVSYAGTAVFLGLSAWSWATIRNVEQDPAFQRARLIAGSAVSDVCATSSNFGVEELGSLCSKADRHETLQWVFLSMGLASAGVGTWLLVKSVRSKHGSDRARLNLAPIAGKRRGGVTARLRF
jgi:hypothetical protein